MVLSLYIRRFQGDLISWFPVKGSDIIRRLYFRWDFNFLDIFFSQNKHDNILKQISFDSIINK